MPKSVEYYLEKGFDRPMAEYFASGRKKLTNVIPQRDFTLLLTFDNEEKRVFDMKPLINKGGVFDVLRDYNRFSRVYLDDTDSVAWDIDPDINSDIVWDNKIDLCPDTCYVDSIPFTNYKEVG